MIGCHCHVLDEYNIIHLSIKHYHSLKTHIHKQRDAHIGHNLLNFRVFGPQNLAHPVHGHGGFFPAQLDEDAAFVVAECHVIRTLLDGQ